MSTKKLQIIGNIGSGSGGAITPENIGAVKKSGDTMTGKLLLKGGIGPIGDGYLQYMFYSNDEQVRGSLQVSSANRIIFNQQQTGSEYKERYMMPDLATDLTADVWYNMLTTKNPVTVGQGGTGATDAPTARANLGITPANIGAVSNAGDTMTGDLVMTESNVTINQGTKQRAFTMTRTVSDVEYKGEIMESNSGTFILRHINAGAEKNRLTLTDEETILTKALTVASGGTGAKTAKDALTNLGIVYSSTQPTYVEGKIWLKPV